MYSLKKNQIKTNKIKNKGKINGNDKSNTNFT